MFALSFSAIFYRFFSNCHFILFSDRLVDISDFTMDYYQQGRPQVSAPPASQHYVNYSTVRNLIFSYYFLMRRHISLNLEHPGHKFRSHVLSAAADAGAATDIPTALHRPSRSHQFWIRFQCVLCEIFF